VLPRAARRDGPPHLLVDAAVDLALDPVEEAGDEGVVVLGAELAARRQRRLQLLFRQRVDPQTVGDRRPRGKLGPICYNGT
jgi:hypothetical protein